MKKLLVDHTYRIHKQSHKGGWHYVEISEIPISKRSSQGLVRVSGTVNDYEIKQFNLIPMKEGKMMLPIKTELRKSIRKNEGDVVQVKLYSDKTKVFVPDAIRLTIADSPKALIFFKSLSDSNKKYYIDWIESAKRIVTKINRISKAIVQLEKGIKFYDWPDPNKADK